MVVKHKCKFSIHYFSQICDMHNMTNVLLSTIRVVISNFFVNFRNLVSDSNIIEVTSIAVLISLVSD